MAESQWGGCEVYAYRLDDRGNGTSRRKMGAAMKKFFVAVTALAAWVSVGFGGIKVEWSNGGGGWWSMGGI